jgi:DNA gyrase subunit B
MTDADVDGSHIRTLLLTFFFRQMNELVARGHLYIAQPPLYKVKRGRMERYLASEKDFAELIVSGGIAGTDLVAEDGKRTTEEPLKRALLELQELKGLLRNYEEQREDPRVLRVLSTFTNINAETFSSEEALNKVKDQVLAGLNGKVSGELSASLKQDSESTYSLHVITRLKGVLRESILTRVEAFSTNFRKLQHMSQLSQDLGTGAFKLVNRESGKEEATAMDVDSLLQLVDERGRKGLSITRYKGLGEMNPEQLWETTMDPTIRSMLQVRVDDALEADGVFTVLMGDEVEPRRRFIEENALKTRNLDI